MSGKLMILAAGMSSRMKKSFNKDLDFLQLKQANSRPKCMIELGRSKTPFLFYLLENSRQAGFKEICIILNVKDCFTESYFRQNFGENLKIFFIYQNLPKNRLKPMGTADAVLQGVKSLSHWKETSFVVCNSDNLYSVNAFKILLNSVSKNAMINYDYSGLCVDRKKLHSFSVIISDSQGYLSNIIEKPNEEQIKFATRSNRIGISMNIFKFYVDDILRYLEQCPVTDSRNEKELPTAVQLMINDKSKIMKTYLLSEAVPDLTNKSDITKVEEYLN